MRVALIANRNEGAGAAETARPKLAGRSIAHRQADLALELGCERIVCLTDHPSPEIARMQAAAEKGGARFHAIVGPRHLPGLVKAVDEVLVIAPDLVAEAPFVSDALAGRTGILALPAERGVAAGHERMDGESAWAGVMLLPGALVDRLADLPPDCDPISGLLRIAMQASTRRVLLAPSALDHGELTLVRDAAVSAKAEKAWLDRRSGQAGWRRPASAAVRSVTRLLAPRLLARERTVPILVAAGSLLSAGGVAAAIYERAGAGLAMLAVAAAAFLAGDTLRALGSGARPEPNGSRLAGFALDAALITVAVIATPREPQVALFSSVVAVFALRLARLHGSAAPVAPFADRILVLILAALAAAFGTLVPALQLFAVASLGFELFVRSRSRLTQV